MKSVLQCAASYSTDTTHGSEISTGWIKRSVNNVGIGYRYWNESPHPYHQPQHFTNIPWPVTSGSTTNV